MNGFEVKDTAVKGKGLFATRNYQKDEFILFVNGDIIESKDKLPLYQLLSRTIFFP